MFLLNRYSLKVQLFIFITSLVILFFVLSGIVMYSHEKELILRQNDAFISHQVDGICDRLDLSHKDMLLKVEQGMLVAEWVFYQNYSGEIQVHPENKIKYHAVNQISKDTSIVYVDQWVMDDQVIQGNTVIVDRIQNLGPPTVTIFQKIPKGYLRISTNVRKKDGQRAVGTFIPNYSPVVKAIEEGKKYTGRAFVVDDWYTTVYSPIYVDGIIQGILYVGEREIEATIINKQTKTQRFLDAGYAFIMSDNAGFDGLMIVHPELEGVNIKTSPNLEQNAFYRFLVNNYNPFEGENPIISIRSRNSLLGEDVMVFYKYNQAFRYYVGIVVPYSNFVQDELEKLIFLIINRFIIGMLVVMVVIYFFARTYTIQIEKVIDSMQKLNKGIIPDPIKFKGKDEFAKTTKAINILSYSRKELINQVQQVEQGNYNVKVKVKSDGDQLAISFNNMAKKLMTVEIKHQHQLNMRLAEKDLFDKTRFSKNLKEFAENALFSISQFLHSQIGALYVYDSYTKKLHLQSSFGIELPKSNPIIELGQGMVGKIAQHLEIIEIVKDIPTDFYTIDSGIGAGIPKELVLMPLSLNSQLLGVVELGSFSSFSETDMDLVNLLKDNLSISLSINQSRFETQALLEQIQVQTEELRVTNDTLEKQAQSLQVSEENLQVQQEELRVTNEELELQAQSLMKSEEELTKQKEVLEKEVQKRQEAQTLLEMAVTKANAATKAKSMFLANMSHEIRTPMNGVIGISDILSQTELTKEQQGYVKLITTSANNLLTIINDILDFSKIEAGKIEMESIPFSLKRIIEDTADVLQFKAAEQNNELFTFIDPQVPLSLIGDPVRLQQVIMNLANNAVKFTENGEITISCEFQKQEGNQAHLLFKVKDTGIGISKEGQEKLFKSFTQVDASTTRKFGGTGLGLVISKKLVEKMRGEFGVESEENSGSTFFFSAIFEIDTNEQLQNSIANRNYENLNILVVDNHEPSRMIFTKYLESKKAKITCVSSTLEGIEIVNSRKKEGNPFQLVFVDYQMPEMNGMQFIKKLQSEIGHHEIRFVLLTAQQNIVSNDQKDQLEIAGFLNKPLKRWNLYHLIEKIIYGIDKNEELLSSNKKMKENRKNESIRKLRILLAEDNLINQKVAVYNLQEWGHEVVVADNGEIAFQIFVSKPFDLILMDIQMPVLDGLKATQKIREYEKEKGLKPIKIVAMTANALKGDDKICYDAGMNGYISKPFKRENLETIIYT